MRIVICDDQKEVRESFSLKIRKICPAADIILYSSGDELLAGEVDPDILFLDIQMPGRNGMETARELRRRNGQMILIFITVMEEYVFQAFDVGAFHYLVKPFSDGKLQEVFQKAVRQYQAGRVEEKVEESFMIIHSQGCHRKILLNDIEYAEVFNRKVILHKKNEEIRYYGKLSALEEQAGQNFFRCHRAYLVNFKYVVKYNASTVWLESGGEALIAKQNYSRFVQEFLKYNRRERGGW